MELIDIAFEAGRAAVELSVRIVACHGRHAVRHAVARVTRPAGLDRGRSGACPETGGVDTPILQWLQLDPAIILPTLTKYLAGDTALLGLFSDMHRAGTLDTGLVNESAGWLIHAHLTFPARDPGFGGQAHRPRMETSRAWATDSASAATPSGRRRP